MQIFEGGETPSTNRALVGSPLKSSAVTVHLAGSGTLKLERISSVYVHSWERHCVACVALDSWMLLVGKQLVSHAC